MDYFGLVFFGETYKSNWFLVSKDLTEFDDFFDSGKDSLLFLLSVSSLLRINSEDDMDFGSFFDESTQIFDNLSKLLANISFWLSLFKLVALSRTYTGIDSSNDFKFWANIKFYQKSF